MRISDWSSDVCSSDLSTPHKGYLIFFRYRDEALEIVTILHGSRDTATCFADGERSEEHTSELQSLMRISYAVFCLKNKITPNTTTKTICNIQHGHNMTKHRPSRTLLYRQTPNN